MNVDRNNKKLDELICRAIGRDKPKFDFDKWKARHREELQIYKSQTAEQKTSKNARIFKIGRITMKSPITKIAVAAAIVIAAALLLQNSSVNITSTAFGLDGVITAMSEAKWVHITWNYTKANVKSNENEEELKENWISVSPDRKISVYKSGFINFTEHLDFANEIKTQRFDPKTNTVTTTYISTIENYISSDSLIDSFREDISRLESQGVKVQFTDTIYDGRPAKSTNIIITPEIGIQLEYSIVADVETRLPKLLTLHKSSSSGTNVIANATFYYPESGPSDIYKVGAPKNAEVVIVDYRPDVEFLELIKPYRTARENLPAQCIVVEVENENNSRYRVCIICTDGVKERFEQLMWVRNDTPPTTEDFNEILDWTRRAKSDELGIQLYDGEYMYHVERDYRDRWTNYTCYSPRSKPEYVVGGLTYRGWPRIRNGKPAENSYATKNNLLCIETWREANIKENQLLEPAEKTLYYIDPEHDYICVRIESFSYLTPPYGKPEIDDLSFEPSEIPTEPYWVTKVTKFGQTDTGQWYPKEVTSNRLSWWLDYPGNTDTPEDEKFMIRLYLDINPEFPEGIFDPNKLPN